MKDTHESIVMTLVFSNDVNENWLGLGVCWHRLGSRIEPCGGTELRTKCYVTGELYFAARLLGPVNKKKGAKS
jgi:hypothetical protein